MSGTPIYPTAAQAKVTSLDMPWLALVNQSDPEFNSDKHRQVEYETSRRVFYADPYNRGVYGSDQPSRFWDESDVSWDGGFAWDL